MILEGFEAPGWKDYRRKIKHAVGLKIDPVQADRRDRDLVLATHVLAK